MPVQTREKHYLDPYRRSHARHGSSFEVTLWASPQSQRRRFEVFADMCPLAGKRILDAGCSRGDFAAYLLERGTSFGHYTGIDALPEVVLFANQRGLTRCEFICGDFLTHPELFAASQPDIICISGSLNTMSFTQACAVLESAWAAADEALAFNFLSDRCGPEAPLQDGYSQRFSADELLDWAFASTPLVAFRQDYFQAGHDATIVMRREA